MTFTGVEKHESVGSHLVVKNAKISSKIHILLSIYSHRWRRRTKSDQRMRTYERKVSVERSNRQYHTRVRTTAEAYG